jgi:hypothetical protein
MRKLLILAVAAVLLAGACGSDDAAENPQGSIDDAVNALSDYEGYTITLTIGSTADSLVALSEGAMTAEQAQQILDSSFSMSTTNTEDPKEAAGEMALDIAGKADSFELKFVGGTMYLRADVAGIMDTFGADPSQLDAFTAQAGSQPGFEFVEPAINGEWIAMTGFDQLLQQAGSSQNQLTEGQQKAIDGFAQALKENTQTEAGDKDGPGTNLVVTANLRDLYQAVLDLQDTVGGAAGEMPSLEEVPDEDVSIDTWVDGDRLTQIQLDLTQFKDIPEAEFPEGVEEFAITVGLEEFTGGVQAPDGATEVDVNQIMQGIFGGLGGSIGGDTGGDTGGGAGEVDPGELCDELEKQLEGQPDEVVEQFVDLYGQDCPNLGK